MALISGELIWFFVKKIEGICMEIRQWNRHKLISLADCL